MDTDSQTKTLPAWVSLIGDLRFVSDFLAAKPFASVWAPLIFVDALCRGFAQVLFANNPITGLAVIVGLAVASPVVAAAGLFTTAVALVTSVFLQQPRENICAGLTSFSAVIVGTVIMALAPSFLNDEIFYLIWLFLFFGAIFSVYLTIAMVNIFKTVQPALPCCTLPFNVVTFMTLVSFRLLSQSHQSTHTREDLTVVVDEFSNVTDGDSHAYKLFIGTLVSMSQVYAVESVSASVIIYLGLILCSPISVVMSAVGSAVGTCAGAAILGPSGYASAYSGLLGFNSLLTAAGLGGFFWVLSVRSFITAVLCSLFTLVIQLLFASSLNTASLPVCTLPFVTSTILFLATSTVLGDGLQRPTTVSFPEMHCYDALRSATSDSAASGRPDDGFEKQRRNSPTQERFLTTSTHSIP